MSHILTFNSCRNQIRWNLQLSWLHQRKFHQLWSRRESPGWWYRYLDEQWPRMFVLMGCYPTWAFLLSIFVFHFFLFNFLTCCLLFFFLSVSSWPCKTFSWPCKTPFVAGVFYFSFYFGCHVRLFWWRTHPFFFSVTVHLTFSFLVYPSWADPTLELVPAFLS